MRIYLLSEGSNHAPTETVKSVHQTLSAAVGVADEKMDLGLANWEQVEEPALEGCQKMWIYQDLYYNFYITQWETEE